MRKLGQPFLQTQPHLARRFFGEGDGQNFMRFTSSVFGIIFQQRPQHPRHQHPGFAGTGAGLNGHAAARIAGDGVKLVAGDALAIQLVGGLDHWRHAASLQKSLRHNPRAAQ